MKKLKIALLIMCVFMGLIPQSSFAAGNESGINIDLICPSVIEMGESVELEGTITSSYRITEVYAIIFHSRMKAIGYYPTTIYPYSGYVDIKESGLSDGLYFEGMPMGEYILEITVKDSVSSKTISHPISIVEPETEVNEDFYYEEDEPYADEIAVKLDGREIYFDQPPIIEDGRTLVPLRTIFESLGAEVEWYGDTQTVVSTKGDICVTLTIGENMLYVYNYATLQSREVYLDVPAKIVNERTLVPVRAIAESFNCYVDWDGDTQTVIINSINDISNSNEGYYANAENVVGTYSHSLYPNNYFLEIYACDGKNVEFGVTALKGSNASSVADIYVADSIDDGVCKFNFTDNFGNTGTGVLTVDGEMATLSFNVPKYAGWWCVDAAKGSYIKD